MKRFSMIAAAAALFGCAGMGCASDAGNGSQNLRQPTAADHTQSGKQSGTHQKTTEEDSRVVEGPGGAIMIIHDENDWVQEKIPRQETEQPAQ